MIITLAHRTNKQIRTVVAPNFLAAIEMLGWDPKQTIIMKEESPEFPEDCKCPVCDSQTVN